MKSKRILALLILVVMLVPLFASCGGLGPTGTTEPSQTTAGQSTTGPTSPTPNPPDPDIPEPQPPVVPTLSLTAIENLSEYTIVYPETAGDDVIAAITALRDAIAAATGDTLTIASDALVIGETVPTDTKEILFGYTNRAESAASASLRYYDFYVAFENGRLAFLAGNDTAIISAVDFAEEELLGEDSLSYVTGGYHYAMEYPLDNLTLLGRPIRDFVIVREAGNGAEARYIADCIRKTTGYDLPIRTTDAPEAPYEILLGNTGRDATAAAVAAGNFSVSTTATKVALYGNGEYAAYRAAVYFAKTYLTGTSTVLSIANETKPVERVALYTLNIPETLGAFTITKPENAGGVWERFVQAKDELPKEITVIDRVLLSDYPLSSLRMELFVSPTGDDSAAGTKEAPLATISEAVERVGYGGGVIWLLEGTHELKENVKISAANSGTPTSPLFIKAYTEATVSTFRSIDTSWFTEMQADDPLADRLDSSAINFTDILVADLAEHNFTAEDITELFGSSDGYGPEQNQSRSATVPVLLIGETEYNLARYPNEGEEMLCFATAYETGRVTGSTSSELYTSWLDRCEASSQLEPTTPLGWEISLGTRNQAQHDRGKDDYVEFDASKDWERYAPILDWVDTGNIWFFGRPYADWANARFQVHVGRQADGSYRCYNNDLDKPSIYSPMPYTLGARSTSSASVKGHGFYLYNAIEALDVPGEWFLDTQSEKLRLYLCPPAEYWGEETIGYTSNNMSSAFTFTGASNVVFDGIDFIGTGKSALSASSGAVTSNIVIQDCNFRNVGSAISISGENKNIGIIHCDFRSSHNGHVTLQNNAAPSLSPDHNVIQNCFFGDPMPLQQTGLSFSGCRTIVSHNFFEYVTLNLNGPCYESIVEYNRCDGGSQDVGDGGQIYTYGLYSRNNHIRYNVLHALCYSGNNMYNDGMCSGNYFYYNVTSSLTGIRESNQKGYYISSGHNNVCYNNILIGRTSERVVANAEAGGYTVAAHPGFWHMGKLITDRILGDNIIGETTLFYCDTTDKGYVGATGRSDSASYSWDQLYTGAAQQFTGGRAYPYFDPQKWQERDPNWIAAMNGAKTMFNLMSAMGKDYDRRTAVLELEAKFDEKVAEMLAAGATQEEAEAEAFRCGYGYTEDFFRQPAYNVYKSNIQIGGDDIFYFDSDQSGVFGDAQSEFVNSDYLNNRGGVNDDGSLLAGGNDPFARDFRIIETNFYCFDYNDLLVKADAPLDSLNTLDYSFLPGALDSVRAVAPDFYDFTGDLTWKTDWQDFVK